MTLSAAQTFESGWRMVRGETLNDNVVTPLNAAITEINANDVLLSALLANAADGDLGFTTNAAVTAFAGGGQASATQLTGAVANVTVVATAAASVKLPAGETGKIFFLQNSDAADSVQVFGNGTDTINGVATATGVAQAAGKSAIYFCVSPQPAAKWFRVLSA